MKTIMIDELAKSTGDGFNEALKTYVEMDVNMGALEALEAQLRNHGLELDVVDVGRVYDSAKLVKVVKTAAPEASRSSWEGDVDRQGGSFTADELYNSTRW